MTKNDSLFPVFRRQRPAAGVVIFAVAALVATLLNGLGPSQMVNAAGGLDFHSDFNPNGFSNAALAWGDFDNDGDLDLLAAGMQGGTPVAPFADVYVNDGTGALTALSAGFEGVQNGAVAWVDFDPNDNLGVNYLDALVVGSAVGSENYVAHLYRYNGTAFVESGIPLLGLSAGSASWGDYDSDGDSDLLLTGEDANTSAQTTLLYANEYIDPLDPALGRTLTLVGDSRDSALNLGLEGYSYGDSQWCDFNQDGRMDLLLTGSTLSNGPRTLVYRWNITSGRFEDTGAGLPGLLTSSAACGDFNADGYPDLLLAGASGVNFTPQTYIYRNTQTGWSQFAASPMVPGATDLKGASFAAVAWGDINDDGLLDALVTGKRSSLDETSVYYNVYDSGTGSYSFVPSTDLALTNVSRGAVAFGDANGDNDLDLALAGQSGALKAAELYLNPTDTVTPETDNAAPVLSLSSSEVRVTVGAVQGTNDADILISPDPFVDEETPPAGMTYRLMLWRMNGLVQEFVVRPSDPAAGLGTSSMVRAVDGYGFHVSGLIHGQDYYWWVQAIDASYATSAWVDGGSFLANAAPTAGVDAYSVDEDSSILPPPGDLTHNVLANDADLDFDGAVQDTISIVPGSLVRTTASPPAGAAYNLDNDGYFTYTPPPDGNQDETFTYQIVDNHGQLVTGFIDVTVNPTPDPTTTQDETFTINEDRPTALPITLTASDPDALGPKASPLVFSVVTSPTRGTLVAPSDGAWTYTVLEDYSGSDTIEFSVSSNGGAAATGTIHITITPSNDAPRQPVPPQVFNAMSTIPFSDTVVAYDPDNDPVKNEVPANQTLTYTRTNPLPTLGTVTINPNGTFDYIPGTNYGTDHFYFIANDGIANSTPIEVTVEVDRINLMPVATDQIFNSTTPTQPVEDTPFSAVLTVSDPDNDLPLSFDTTAGPSHGWVSFGETTPGVYGFTYHPNQDYFGADAFTYEVTDFRGGTDTATVTLDILPVDDAPHFVTASDLPETLEETPLNGTIEAAQPANEPGDQVTLSVQEDPTRGTLDFNTTSGAFTYTPSLDNNGPDAFVIRASQPGSSLFTDKTFHVMVRQVNDLPTASNLALEINEDSGVHDSYIVVTDVDNDPVLNQDPDNSAPQTMTVTVVTKPPHTTNLGTFTLTQDEVTPANWDYSYEPVLNYYGIDPFTFTIYDGVETTAEITATVTVLNVNDFPQTVLDAMTVLEDSDPTDPNNCRDVVANDLDPNTIFPDPGVPTVSSVTAPLHGTAEVIDGLVCYTPFPNYNGTDTFQYQLSDGIYTPFGTVTVTVTPVPDTPVITPIGNQAAAPTILLTFPVVATDGDAGDVLTLSVVYQIGGVDQPALPTGVTFTGSGANRTFSWTPIESQVSAMPYTFKFTVTDSTNRSSTETVEVLVSTISDLSLSGDVTPNPVDAGTSLDLFMMVENIGISDVTGVEITTTLPVGVTFNAVRSSAGCTAVGQVVTCSLSELLEGGATSFTVVGDVATDAVDGSTLSFTATVTAAELDIDLTNNSFDASTVVRNIPVPEVLPVYLPLLFNGN